MFAVIHSSWYVISVYVCWCVLRVFWCVCCRLWGTFKRVVGVVRVVLRILMSIGCVCTAFGDSAQSKGEDGGMRVRLACEGPDTV